MALPLIIILIPLGVYLVAALGVKRTDVRHPDEFFLAYRAVGATPFSNSSIAYAFQVATVYPFLGYAATGQLLAPALNGIFWGVGILIFAMIVNRYSHFFGTHLSLHGLLGTCYAGDHIRIVTSILTIVGLLGIAVAETYWGSKAISAIFPVKQMTYIVMFLCIYFVFTYISYGGQLSSIRTDQAQIVVSYIGVFGLIAYLLYAFFSRGLLLTAGLAWSLCALAVYIPIVLWLRRARFIESVGGTIFGRFTAGFSNVVIVISLSILFVLTIITIIGKSGFAGIGPLIAKNYKDFGDTPKCMAISLIFLPACWQFVDMTNWQRLLCVKFESSADEERAEFSRRVVKGLLVYAVESPFTWLIFIPMGLLIAVGIPGVDLTDVLMSAPAKLAASPHLIDRLASYTFITSILAIMLSTVDSVIMGMMFAFVYDTLGWSQKILDRNNGEEIRAKAKRIIASGNLFGVVIVSATTALFILFDYHLKHSMEFLGVLFAFYTAQLAFFPAVIALAFNWRRPNCHWVFLSITLGALVGLIAGFYATFRNNAWQWYPVPLSLAVSVTLYVLGMLFSKGKTEALKL